MRIGVLTGGGDAPGLNSLIRSLVRDRQQGSEHLLGVRRGYAGLASGDVVELDEAATRGWMHEGGSWLGAESQWQPEDLEPPIESPPHASRPAERKSALSLEFSAAAGATGPATSPLAGVVQSISSAQAAQVEGREIPSARWFDAVVAGIRALRLDVLVAVGGDGTLAVSEVLASRYGIPIIGVPKTIDGDVNATPLTLGFSTAREIVCRSCDEVRASARTHRRTQIVECMGRNSGRLALDAGLAADIDAVVIAEAHTSVAELAEAVNAAHARQSYSIVLVAEGARWREAAGASTEVQGADGWLAKELKEHSRTECRVLALGHVQRGAPPCALDRAIAARAAHRVLLCARRGEFGIGIAIGTLETRVVPLAEMAGTTRLLRPEDEIVRVAAARGLLLPRDFAQGRPDAPAVPSPALVAAPQHGVTGPPEQ